MLDLKEIYIIAKKNESGTNPVAEDMYSERFYFSRIEAEHVIEAEFAPFMRGKMGVFAASLTIGSESAPNNFTLPPMNGEPVSDDSSQPVVKSWEDDFSERHESNPSINQSDYYFQVHVDPVDGDSFIITPKEYFDKTGKILDMEECVPAQILPPGFSELTDSTYEYSGATARGRFTLLTNGFVENKMV